MTFGKLATVGLAVLLVTAGVVAAIPEQAADRAQHAQDDDHADAPTDEGNNETAAGNGRPVDVSAERGPPTDLPDQVPGFVSEIHRTIGDWLDGLLDGSLGEYVSDVAGNGDDVDDGADGTADGQ